MSRFRASTIGGLVMLVCGVLVWNGPAVAGVVDRFVRISGDRMNGPLSIARPQEGNLLILGGPTAELNARTICFDTTCTYGMSLNTSSGVLNITGPGVLQMASAGSRVQAPNFTATASNLAGLTMGNAFAQFSGDTQANVFTATPAVNTGALDYDTTNTRFRAYENGQWNVMLTGNLDAGAPFGPSVSLSGHNISTSATIKTVASIIPKGKYRAQALGWNIETAGTGAGTATALMRDLTGASTICSTTFNCASTAGAVTSFACSGTAASAAGNELQLWIDCSTCTTCPVMNITGTAGYIPGS